jgi:hypothetical protein
MGMACEFKIVDRLTLLGMEIRKNLDNVDEIFVKTGEKINELILFWSRFRHSLRVRISVIKTFLLPQLNYLGCFLTPGPELLYGIQELIDSFVIGNLKVSYERRYLPPELGGLRIFKLTSFLTAQQCSWVKRAHMLPIDNWRIELKEKCPDKDLTLLRACDINR